MAAGLAERWLTVALLVVSGAACSRQPNAPSSPVQTPASLRGIVRDTIPAGSGAPVAGARVEAVSQGGPVNSATTAADGSYLLGGLAAGQSYQLNISHEGYQPTATTVALTAGDNAADVLLAPISVTVAGVVTETPPGEATPVESAVVTISSGSNRGRTFATDRTGSFALTSVWGEFDIAVARAGYRNADMHVVARSGARVAVQLAPNTDRARATFTGALCTIERLPSWLTCSAPFERTHSVSVPRPGSLTLTVNYQYVGDYYPNTLTLDVRCDGRTVAQKKFVKQWDAPPIVMPDNLVGTFDLPIAQACNYDLKLWNYVADTKGGSQTTYRVDMEFPR